ncbi:putative leader peptide [Streptomyces lasalocidi]
MVASAPVSLGATVFSRLSRRRHIDLKRSTSCLCQA